SNGWSQSASGSGGSSSCSTNCRSISSSAPITTPSTQARPDRAGNCAASSPSSSDVEPNHDTHQQNPPRCGAGPRDDYSRDRRRPATAGDGLACPGDTACTDGTARSTTG